MTPLVETTSVHPQLGDVIGVVLAGGRSKRMGEDKRLLLYDGIPLIEHAKQSLKHLPLHSVVVSSTDLENSVADLYPDCGPLGGMISVLSQYSQSDVTGFLFVPVDMPMLTDEVLLEIARQGLDYQLPVCFHQQYLPLYLPNNQEVIGQIKHTLDKHNGAVRKLISNMKGKQLEVSDHLLTQNVFRNLNRPEDWIEFIQNGQ